jgi:hypothetical protein
LKPFKHNYTTIQIKKEKENISNLKITKIVKFDFNVSFF